MDAKQKNYIALAALALLLIGSVWSFWPVNTTITQGLDLRGGLSVILTPQQPASKSAMDRALTVMNNRVNGLGVSEATVQLENDNQAILVQLPGVKDARAALDALGSTGQLEFVRWSSVGTQTAAAWDSLLEKQRTGAVTTEEFRKQAEAIKLQKGAYEVLLTGDVITSAKAVVADKNLPGQYAVSMVFNTDGTAKWGDITRGLMLQQQGDPRRVAVVLDGIVQSVPEVQNAIENGQSEITGSFTGAQATQLAAVLESGALPVDLKFSQTEVVGPTLGQDSLVQGVTAALIGIALVGIYLAIYYRGFGVLAWFSLGTFVVLYLGVLATLSRAGQYALSLPGLAGIVLAIGLAADTSILIFERLKEETAMGKSPRTAAKSGSRHAILTSLDADAVTFASAIPLFLFAIGPVKGFALTLMIGIICDLTIAVLFTRPMVMLLSDSVVGRFPALFGVKAGGAK